MAISASSRVGYQVSRNDDPWWQKWGVGRKVDDGTAVGCAKNAEKSEEAPAVFEEKTSDGRSKVSVTSFSISPSLNIGFNLRNVSGEPTSIKKLRVLIPHPGKTDGAGMEVTITTEEAGSGKNGRRLAPGEKESYNIAPPADVFPPGPPKVMMVFVEYENGEENQLTIDLSDMPSNVTRKVSDPIWSEKQVKASTENKGLVYEVSVMQKPAFYDGEMPLKYESFQSVPMGGYMSFDQIYAHSYESFTNVFIYEEGFSIVGAATFDKQGNLVAEARVNYFIKKEKDGGPSQGIELEEFHYGEDGSVIFKCKSKIQEGIGFKVKESKAEGKKEKDYYFIWPGR